MSGLTGNTVYEKWLQEQAEKAVNTDDRERISLELREISLLLSALRLFVRPIEANINGEGVPSYNTVQSAFEAIERHLDRVADELSPEA